MYENAEESYFIHHAAISYIGHKMYFLQIVYCTDFLCEVIV